MFCGWPTELAGGFFVCPGWPGDLGACCLSVRRGLAHLVDCGTTGFRCRHSPGCRCGRNFRVAAAYRCCCWLGLAMLEGLFSEWPDPTGIADR